MAEGQRLIDLPSDVMTNMSTFFVGNTPAVESEKQQNIQTHTAKDEITY